MGIDALGSSYDVNRYQTGTGTAGTKTVAEEEEKKGKPAGPPPGGAPPQGAGGAPGVAPQQSVQQAGANAEVSSLEAQQSSSVVSQLTSSEDDDEDATYQAIVNKANSGQQLTSAELATLQAKNSALYARAVKAQTAREELRSQMEQAPAQAYQQARSAIAAVGNAAQEGEDLAAVHSALRDEYQQFATRFDHVELSGRVPQPFIETEE